MPYFWSANGSAIVDELVEFTTQETIDGVDYYVGWLSNWSDGNVAEPNQSTYGAWTAASKGGTQYTIKLTGVPSSSEAVVKITEGSKVLSTTNTSLYFRYVGHGEIIWTPKMRIYFPYIMTNGVTEDHIVRPVYKNFSVKYFSWRVNSLYVPEASVSLQLRDAVSGGGNYRTLTFGTVGDSTRQNKLTQLDDGSTKGVEMSFDTSKSFVIRGDGKDMGDITIEFF